MLYPVTWSFEDLEVFLGGGAGEASLLQFPFLLPPNFTNPSTSIPPQPSTPPLGQSSPSSSSLGHTSSKTSCSVSSTVSPTPTSPENSNSDGKGHLFFRKQGVGAFNAMVHMVGQEKGKI